LQISFVRKTLKHLKIGYLLLKKYPDSLFNRGTKMNKPAILYDSYCKLCNAEIKYYKNKDPRNLFEYVDIMNPKFDANKYQLTKSEVHKFFHVITKDGDILAGVDAFNYIWKELDTFILLQHLYSLKIGKFLMKLGYNGFVKARPYLPRKKECGDYCET
jgi:predicted DCC family thiol-disulfide oxidoreductase YuxK